MASIATVFNTNCMFPEETDTDCETSIKASSKNTECLQTVLLNPDGFLLAFLSLVKESLKHRTAPEKTEPTYTVQH